MALKLEFELRIALKIFSTGTDTQRATVGGGGSYLPCKKAAQEIQSTSADPQPHMSSVSLKTVLSSKFLSHLFLFTMATEIFSTSTTIFFLGSTSIVLTTLCDEHWLAAS